MSSTPINKIPAQPTQEAEDPEVLAILKEMQQSEPQTTSQVQHTPPPMQYYAPPPAPPMKHQQPVPAVVTTEAKPFFQIDLAQKAAAAAVIAFILFYPKTLAYVYEKLPQVVAYDPLLRTALLAIVLYLVMWKLNI